MQPDQKGIEEKSRDFETKRHEFLDSPFIILRLIFTYFSSLLSFSLFSLPVAIYPHFFSYIFLGGIFSALFGRFSVARFFLLRSEEISGEQACGTANDRLPVSLIPHPPLLLLRGKNSQIISKAENVRNAAREESRKDWFGIREVSESVDCIS